VRGLIADRAAWAWRCPRRCGNGSKSRIGAHKVPGRARAAGGNLSARRQVLFLVLLSVRGQASPTRRSACCSRAGWRRARLRPPRLHGQRICNSRVYGLGDVAVAAFARRELSLDALFGTRTCWATTLEGLACGNPRSLKGARFRSCAIIAGLIERPLPGQGKNRGPRRSPSPPIWSYDVLRAHQGPITSCCGPPAPTAATGLLGRGAALGEMLSRRQGANRPIKALDHVLAAGSAGHVGNRARERGAW